MFTVLTVVSYAQLEGTWKMSPQPAALGVGPALGDISWWSNTAGDVTTRACYFDDEYVFHEGGSFTNVQQDESWIEEWQGMDPPGCATPVYPHNGANAATWTYNESEGTITLTGVGAYIGLAKVYNEGELSTPDDAPESITYMVEFNATGDTMTLNISIAVGYWRFILTSNGGTPPPPAEPLALPITFNDEDIDYSISDFDGTTSEIIVDPNNPDNHVVQTIKTEAAQFWAGTIVGDPEGIETPMPFTEGNTTMSVKVYSPEAGIPVLFKMEDSNDANISVEVQVNTTVGMEWETMYFDMTNVVEGTAPFDFANTYNKPVIFFNFGVDGATAGEMTFMFDDIDFVDASSINENEYKELSVYPNPAQDIVNIENPGNLTSIKVYSVTGQLMLDAGNQLSVDVSNYPSGLYTITAVDSEDQKYTSRFMVK